MWKALEHTLPSPLSIPLPTSTSRAEQTPGFDEFYSWTRSSKHHVTVKSSYLSVTQASRPLQTQAAPSPHPENPLACDTGSSDDCIAGVWLLILLSNIMTEQPIVIWDSVLCFS